MESLSSYLKFSCHLYFHSLSLVHTHNKCGRTKKKRLCYFVIGSSLFALRFYLPISQISNSDVMGKLAIADNKNVNRIRIDCKQIQTKPLTSTYTHTHQPKIRNKRETTSGLCVCSIYIYFRYFSLYL